MRVSVLANGIWDADWGKDELAGAAYLVCADGGANSALNSGHFPQAVIGDLDSITPENLRRCRERRVEIRSYPREKDETDLELALAFAEGQALPGEEITLYGATGGRPDHFLGNLALLMAYARRGRKIRMKDPQQEMWIIRGREVLKGRAKQELSLIALSETALVTITGVHYPLDKAVLRQDSPRGLSNVFLGEEATVEVCRGQVLLILRFSS
ncbi:thiamine diphosphokinase [Acididesulfobacillus acetoxydans]|uniref:Thiamine diphosphokinase n=1 Tax=Acididesulfobacillus acetoxydans TaxID=1561005 RepID=A0A8S0W9P0_9FIRM|nr:thiamine diphosphokinase [Acididesulfobacillus acetoxydans]CAA7602749.1 thiamine diphosphokinase [Acididesulfobacillus acetoxydans]CEJ06394.1 Thiamine pyrophosphokinase [Acididesulfobacillus acetoxydans]